MEKKYEVKDKEDSIKNFFLQYADRISSEVNYELRKKKKEISQMMFLEHYTQSCQMLYLAQ